MSNIEIRGLDQTSAMELRNRLFFVVFFAKPYYFDLTVEIVSTNVIDGFNNARPYFYVAFTDEDHESITEIKKLLSGLGDVQSVRLAEFIPAKEELNEKMVFAEIWRRPLGTTAKNLALLLYGHEPNPWLRTVLRKFVREGIMIKTSTNKGALYKPNLHSFDIFLNKYAGISFARPNT